jgi:hypothetical protein
MPEAQVANALIAGEPEAFVLLADQIDRVAESVTWLRASAEQPANDHLDAGNES